jgi:alpha-beta hydrolase superfamily lysophospholipase
MKIMPHDYSGEMPEFLDEGGNDDRTFKYEETKEMVKRDAWGVPGGLSHAGRMRWATAVYLIDMLKDIDKNMKNVKCPLLIMHDPADAVTKIEGSKKLIEESATEVESKSLIEVRSFDRLLYMRKICESMWDVSLMLL